ncbi:putative transcriptional regulator [Salmonella phage 19]|nr:putative transcriptional regulator [Salmonella phage 19]
MTNLSTYQLRRIKQQICAPVDEILLKPTQQMRVQGSCRFVDDDGWITW